MYYINIIKRYHDNYVDELPLYSWLFATFNNRKGLKTFSSKLESGRYAEQKLESSCLLKSIQLFLPCVYVYLHIFLRLCHTDSRTCLYKLQYLSQFDIKMTMSNRSTVSCHHLIVLGSGRSQLGISFPISNSKSLSVHFFHLSRCDFSCCHIILINLFLLLI